MPISQRVVACRLKSIAHSACEREQGLVPFLPFGAIIIERTGIQNIMKSGGAACRIAPGWTLVADLRQWMVQGVCFNAGAQPGWLWRRLRPTAQPIQFGPADGALPDTSGRATSEAESEWRSWMKAHRVVLAAILLVAGHASLAAPASGAVRTAKPHCVVELDGLGGHQPPRCFATFAESVIFGTRGSVRLARTVRPNDVTDRLLKQDPASRRAQRAVTAADEPLPCEPPCDGGAVTTYIGIDYADRDYGGFSVAWTVRNDVGCTTGFTYAADRMPGRSGYPGYWNDRVSSAKALGGCFAFLHYEHTFQRGLVIRCTCASGMGTMSDETSSVEWLRR